MSATKAVDSKWDRSPGKRQTPGSLVALEVVLGLLAIGATQGGIAMIRDPYTPLGLTTEALEGAPVDTFVLPGWFLVAIAVASSLTLIGLVTGWRWGWAAPIERSVGHRWPWLGSVATGAVLLVFEMLELFMIPFHPVMHPLLIAVALALLVLPFSRRLGRSLEVAR